MIHLSKSIIKRYNNPDTLVVLSHYPGRGELYSTGKSGVASYTKNVIKNVNRNTIVLCDIETVPEAYIEGKALVIRCFTKGSAVMWMEAISVLRQFREVKTMLTQYDFAMYGSPFVSGLGLMFLGLLRLTGYRTFVTLHHVVDDVTKLKGHVGLTNSPKDIQIGNIYNFMFHTFYRLLSLVSSQVIVLEDSLKAKLAAIAPWVRVASIPHGVDTTLKPMNAALAKRKLGIPKNEPVVLFFGYVNWFKGADIFARTFGPVRKMFGKRLHVVIAGGESPTLKTKAYYQNFFHTVREEVRTSHNIKFTGYVPQKDIATYFSAADLVVFPYRHYMTASGVLSLVFSYRKPFIISRPLAQMFHSEDFSRHLSESGLKASDITFDLYPHSMVEMTRAVLANGRKAKLAHMASELRSCRAFSRTGKLYEELLFAPTLSQAPQAAVRYS